MSRMPVMFFGHGSPMIALQTNAVTQRWAEMANRSDAHYGRPKAIVLISAHWLTQGTSATAMMQPKTIHDFGAFPQALFDVQYPAPGAPEIARRIAELLAPTPVTLDQSEWGFDHGTWSVLVKAYPNADVPVVQVSMNIGLEPSGHFEIGKRLSALRDEGILIVGSGNIVHNLPRMDWSNQFAKPYEWSEKFNQHIKNALLIDRPADVIGFADVGEAASLSVPTPDHFWPLLYVLGARRQGDVVEFGPDHIEHGSLSMTSFALWPELAA